MVNRNRGSLGQNDLRHGDPRAPRLRRRHWAWLALLLGGWACDGGIDRSGLGPDDAGVNLGGRGGAPVMVPDGGSHGGAGGAPAMEGLGGGGSPSTVGQGGTPSEGLGGVLGAGGANSGGQAGSSSQGAGGGTVISHSGGAGGFTGAGGRGGNSHPMGGAGASGGHGGTTTGGVGVGGARTGGAGPGGGGMGGSAIGGMGIGGMGGTVAAGGQAGGAPGGNSMGGAAGSSPISLTLAEGGDYQVIQRILGGTAQSVAVHGTFIGASIVHFQAEVVDFATGLTVAVPWTALGGASGGTFSGSISVPQGGWYRLIVRGLDAGSVELVRANGTRRFGVGINVLCTGQSNMTGFGGFTYTPAVDLAGLFSNDRAWKHLADPYDSGGSASDVDFDAGAGASMIPALVNALAGYFPGIPIGVVPTARGSSPLDCTVDPTLCWNSRNAAQPADPSNLYGNSVAKARAAGGVEVIVMHQGETDATNMTPGATYRTDLARLAASYRVDLGDVPLFICQLGRSTTTIASKNRTDATMQAIRVAQHDSDNPPQVYLAATTIDLDVDSTDHYTKATYDTVGRRMAATIAHHYGALGAPSAYRGPEISTVAYTDATRTRIDVHLTHRGGTDFTPASGINGFAVLDGGVPATISTVVRKDAATVTITLAAPIVGAGAVRYLYGKLPVSVLTNTIHDNSALTLPLEPTAQDLVLP